MKSMQHLLSSGFRFSRIGILSCSIACLSVLTQAVAVEHPTWIVDNNSQLLASSPDQFAYGNGVYLAFDGSNTFLEHLSIFLSEDGEHWKATSEIRGVETPKITSYSDIAFGNGLFVLASGGIFTSRHGLVWNQVESPAILGVDSTAYSFTKVEFQFGEFVAWDPENGVILRSKDGVNWSIAHNLYRRISQVILHGPTQRWFIDVGNSIIAWNEISGWNTLIGRDGYDFELDLVGEKMVILEVQNGTNENFLVANHVSADGDTWQISDSTVFNTFGNDQAYVDTWALGNSYVRFTYDISGTNILTTISESDDFRNWTDVTSYAGAYPEAGVAVGDEFIGKSWISPHTVIRKQDGIWSTQQEFSQTEAPELRYTAYSNGRVENPIFLGIEDHAIYQSFDGFEWEQVATPEVANLSYLEYSEASELFFAFAANAEDSFSVIQSTDGSSWEPLLQNLPFKPQEITVGANGGTILITGQFANQIRVSTDAGASWVENVQGVTWHQPVNSSGAEFNSVYLMTEMVGDTFVLIWDDKAYQSTDGLSWTQTIDLQPGGTWFKYLDSFNGKFMATAVSYEYVGRISIPRWDDTEHKMELWVSSNGSEWNQVIDEDTLNSGNLYNFVFRSPTFDRWGCTHLGAGGPFFYASDGASYISEDGEQPNIKEWESHEYRPDSVRHIEFGKGRFIDQFRGLRGYDPETGNMLLSTLQTTFVGFGNFETDGNGRKQTGWFGALSDDAFPTIDHEVYGEVVFDINDSDIITLSSPEFGISKTSRAHPELVENLIDGITYRVDLSGDSATPFEDLSTSQTSSAMVAESLPVSDWMSKIDELQETIVTLARNTIVAAQEVRTVDAIEQWQLLNEDMQLFESIETLLRTKFDPLDSDLSDRIDARKASAREVYNMAEGWILR